MSREQKRAKTLFLRALTLYLYTLQLCHSVSFGQREDGFTAYGVQGVSPSRSSERIKRDSDAQRGRWRLVEQVVRSADVETSEQTPRRESPALPEKPLSDFNAQKLNKTGSNFAPNMVPWVAGNVTVRAESSGSEHEYQADFPGFHGVLEEVLGPSPDSRHHFSEWSSMKPVVHCGDGAMTVTASGHGFTHLLVDREGASPISLFQLPPNCGFSVRMSRNNLKMMVPYDACYITQEDGTYVLRMLWRGRPLKLSCPVRSAPARSSSAPLVFCSSYAMAVQIYGDKKATRRLEVMVNRGRRPFVSKECAHRGPSQYEALTFFIPYSAACITVADDLHLQLALDEQEYVLSCPADRQLPHFPSPPFLFPDAPQSPSVQDPVTPAVIPPESPAQEPQLPNFPYDPYPGFQYPQLPQMYLPGPQPAHPYKPFPDSPPGLQAPQFTFPTGPRQLLNFPREFPKYPPYQSPIEAQYLYSHFFDRHHPYMPFRYPPVTPAPTLADPEIATPAPQPSRPRNPHYPKYYFELSYYPDAPPPPQSPPEEPIWHRPYHHSSFPLPQEPEMDLPAKPIPSRPTLDTSYVQCLRGRMIVFLPFAHPGSIQIRGSDQMKWLLLSNVSPRCGYKMKMAEGSGVMLHSPLPACHSQSRTSTTISLSLRFWDLSTARYKIAEPQCSYERPPEITAPFHEPVFPRITEDDDDDDDDDSPVLHPKPKVSCSSHEMTVELPSGPISEIVVKDIRGNQMNLQDAPKHCGYSASKTRHGKIRLNLRLHSRCHMSVQDKMYIITVVYETLNGIRERQFSCPVVSPLAGRECNLPREQHLPCGHGRVSQSHCLSMGCCFHKHPPACYYPMDECTIDRHFVFSVPASLTEPPLSPSTLVISGNSTCKPHRVTDDFALFKIPMDGCGARRVMLGQAVIYMVEVVNKVQSISLNFGTITRDSPVRLLVECRFLPGTVLSVGYMVKTPTLGPGVKTQGILGVQLRIAKDARYSSYYPQYHQPLQMLLGKPLYLEVRLLNTPDPNLVLLVHFCVAYPRSAKAVWVLLYNGCPNPLDPDMKWAVQSETETSFPQGQTRRFTISTFQFLPDGEFMDPDEEIYFMCSTEICSPRDGPCVEGCFGQ